MSPAFSEWRVTILILWGLSPAFEAVDYVLPMSLMCKEQGFGVIAELVNEKENIKRNEIASLLILLSFAESHTTKHGLILNLWAVTW